MPEATIRSRRLAALPALALLSCVALACGDAEGLAPGARTAGLREHPKLRRAARPIPGRYIVTLRNDAAPDALARIMGPLTAPPAMRFQHALRGFAGRLTAEEVARLLADPAVLAVEEDAPAQPSAVTQLNAPWGLDRINQHVRPLDGTFDYGPTGAGVKVYVVDSGVRAGHADFTGRVSGGASFIADGRGTEDCFGHGTAVAGVIGGITFGVAKEATLVPVRVSGCDGLSSVSVVLQGLDFIVVDHPFGQPAVAFVGFTTSGSATLDSAVTNVLADLVTVVTPAGNNAIDACGSSPGRVPAVLTVGATDSSDARAGFSSFGTCVDLYAPGLNIPAPAILSNGATTTFSGTSAAAAHVAGIAAVYLERDPNAPSGQVSDQLRAAASAGVVSGAPEGGLLAYSNFFANFPLWAASPQATLLSGDFNGDGKTDLALSGVAGWATIPVAFSNGNGTFTVTNEPVASFADWASWPGVVVLAGDVNGDGRADLVASGPSGWGFIPVAFSNGDGSFSVTARPLGTPGAGQRYTVLGDLDLDGKADLLRTSGDPVSVCNAIVARSLGDGTFVEATYRETRTPTGSSFSSGSACYNSGRPIRFAGAGRLVMTGGSTIAPTSYATLAGSTLATRVLSAGAANSFGAVIAQSRFALAGNFSGDLAGNHDIALLGGVGWTTVPSLYPFEAPSFTNAAIGDFAAWAQATGVKAAAGDFNGDGKTDLTLGGVAGWYTQPVAFSNGDGTFTVTNASY